MPRMTSPTDQATGAADFGDHPTTQRRCGTRWKSPLHEMTQTTPTCLWNDSAALDELQFAIEHGAVGATCNPVIAHAVLKAAPGRMAAAHRRADARHADRHRGRDRRGPPSSGCRSTPPRCCCRPSTRTTAATAGCRFRPIRGSTAIPMPSSARREHFDRLAPNIIVKIPATRAGLDAIEAATAEGISINATVCFTLPQCVAVAEAVERGLRRREAAGHDIGTMGPVCTIMVGRLDDWLKVVMEREGISTDPGHLEWAGVAVFKKTYRLFRERGYRAASALGRVPQSHALERAHRRRRGDFAALSVAEAIRGQRHRRSCRGSTRRSTRRSSTTSTAGSRISAAPTTRTG